MAMKEEFKIISVLYVTSQHIIIAICFVESIKSCLIDRIVQEVLACEFLLLKIYLSIGHSLIVHKLCGLLKPQTTEQVKERPERLEKRSEEKQ